jgi:hypothetical protein
LTQQVAATPVEHFVNPEQGVAVLVDPLPSAPLAWRRTGDGKGFGLGFEAAGPLYFSLPPQSMAAAVARGQLLVIEVGEQAARETWVAMIR